MSDTTFGDFEVADAWDTAPADALPIAQRLHLIRQRLERLVGRDLPDHWNLGAGEQEDLLHIGRAIVEYTTTHSPRQRGDLAEAIVDAAEGVAGSDHFWEDMTLEEQRLAGEVADLIADWLIREGSWQ